MKQIRACTVIDQRCSATLRPGETCVCAVSMPHHVQTALCKPVLECSDNAAQEAAPAGVARHQRPRPRLDHRVVGQREGAIQ